jgi:hypothetical protein
MVEAKDIIRTDLNEPDFEFFANRREIRHTAGVRAKCGVRFVLGSIDEIVRCTVDQNFWRVMPKDCEQ